MFEKKKISFLDKNNVESIPSKLPRQRGEPQMDKLKNFAFPCQSFLKLLSQIFQ